MVSYLEFMQKRENPEIFISLENYTNQLRKKLKNISDYSENKVKKLRELSISLSELQELLEWAGYPETDLILMAVSTHQPLKISEQHIRFQNWSKLNPAKEISQINSILYEYKKLLLQETNQDYNEELIENAVKCIVDSSEQIVSNIRQRIAEAIKCITNWHGSDIVIDAVMSEDEWVVKEVDVIMGGNPLAVCFRYREDGSIVYEKDKSDSPTEEDCINLIEMLELKKNSSSLKTLYFAAPGYASKLKEVKRNLSLGLLTEIPGWWELHETPIQNEDVWKVKLEEKLIFPSDNGSYLFISKGKNPIKWLEQIQ